MWPGRHALERPLHAAYVMAGSGQVVTYRDLNDRSNRLAQLFFDAGLRFGDHVAVFMENRAEFFEPCWAAQRSGLFFTCINTHFNADEVAYILDDCDAQVLVTSDTLADIAAELVDKMPRVKVRLMVGDPANVVDGYEPYESARDRFPAVPLEEELEGTRMLYSSGTTGRPKGVKYKITRQRVGDQPVEMGMMTAVWGMDGNAIYLSPAPLYHSAPLFYSMSTMRLGGTVIVMEHFDPETALACVEQYRVTHSQWVPTMFVRMLKLPDEVRAKYDLSSQKVVLHAAAPCSVETKRKMIEWWGPIIDEYYAATEGTGATYISSADWLAHPGSVGRSMLGPLHILDDAGLEQPVGEVGTVWFEPPPNRPGFEYHKDAAKTRDSFNEKGWSTVGDMGYLDADGYLFLTDRRTFMIVSGGVNIYPQEAENLLIDHPKVYDVAVFGIPDPEMGERVHAVVQPTAWDDAGPGLEQELLAYCRAHLSHYKCPQAVDFDRELPREQTGKLYKRLLRDRYWGDKTSRIV
ncbi:MAG: long-chain acyl-CoA synthetase [Actinomycetota bacterium]|nr:long-chain acyl-CoA synthetase [Actinomycetota bacterium]